MSDYALVTVLLIAVLLGWGLGFGSAVWAFWLATPRGESGKREEFGIYERPHDDADDDDVRPGVYSVSQADLAEALEAAAMMYPPEFSEE